MNTIIKQLFVLFVISGMAISLPNVSYAENKNYGNAEWKEQRAQKRMEMEQKLGITDEQKQQLSEYRKTHRDSMGEYRDQLKTKREALNAAIQKGDVEQARQINEEIKGLKSTIQDKRLESVIGVREILTEEQFSEFMKMKNNRKKFDKK